MKADKFVSGTPPDSGSGSGGEPGGFPGFMGEYLVRDVGSWYASAGSQSNDLLGMAGACTSGQAAFDWAEFGCEAARFRFEFSMQVDPTGYGPAPGGDSVTVSRPDGQRRLAMAAASVDGVRLTWISTPPPLPPGPGPNPIPVDTTGARP